MYQPGFFHLNFFPRNFWDVSFWPEAQGAWSDVMNVESLITTKMNTRSIITREIHTDKL